ncbi:MAG: hypothetical protein EZS28_005155 [Streblomastix strix]|uniref:Uncharacterized protein n=1 Tax=Streblomastix strix TaxID=222440 RepID=A0A5J4WX08_9EUKA|nr:MAG: hypothetical protein EZS28_005155 [Streblomastix strix]
MIKQYSPQTPSNPDRKTGAVESDNEQWPLSLQPRINQSSPRPLLITATGRKDGILESNRDDPLRHLNIPQSLHYSKYNQQQSDTNRNVQQQNRKNISLSQSPNIRNQSLTAQFPRRYQQNFTQREFLKISTFPLVPESVRPTHYSKKFSPLYHTEAGSTFTPPSYTFQRPMFSSQTARTLQAQSFYIPVLQSKHLYMQPIIPGPNGVFEKQNYGLMQRMQEDEEAVKEIRGRFEALYQMNREERNYNTNEADIIDYDKYEKENETLLQQISESENTITQKNSAIIEDNKNQERIESYLQKQYYEEEQEQLAKLNEQQKSQDEIEGQSSEVEQEIKQGFEHLTDLPEMIELGNTIRSNMSETIRSGKDMSTPTSRRRFNKSPVQRTDSKASLIATLRKDMISKDGSGKFMITEDLIPKQEWWVEEEKKDKSKERVQQIDFSVPPTVSPRNHLI